MFEPGDRVKISPACPIDWEGVGPLPGDVGYVLTAADADGMLEGLTVHFERVHAAWIVPPRYLERAET